MTCRFVILFHDGIAAPHFDLMIELEPGKKLATWRCPVWPIARPTPVLRLPDHRADYLTYEGPISNNRGHVKRLSSGVCRVDQMDRSTKITFPAPTVEPILLECMEGTNWIATPAQK